MARREYQAVFHQRPDSEATPVWKQLLGGIVSWQTALVVGGHIADRLWQRDYCLDQRLFGAPAVACRCLGNARGVSGVGRQTSSQRSHNCRELSAEWEKLGRQHPGERTIPPKEATLPSST
ncbi:MAG: hypothetical protein ACLR6J_00450 [Parabacteroides merdae]